MAKVPESLTLPELMSLRAVDTRVPSVQRPWLSPSIVTSRSSRVVFRTVLPVEAMPGLKQNACPTNSSKKGM